MGVDNFSYGSDLVGFVKAESTYGTAIKPAAADAFRASSITLGAPVGKQDADFPEQPQGHQFNL